MKLLGVKKIRIGADTKLDGYFGTDLDPRIRAPDSDIFVIDLQDANKKIFF
jgi:hypothetical protein